MLAIDRFVRMRKFESLTLHEVMQRLKALRISTAALTDSVGAEAFGVCRTQADENS